jgi:penicillin-binding protein 1A
MRSLGRLATVLLSAGVCLGLGVTLLAPEARALLTAGTSRHIGLDRLGPLAQRSIVYAADGTVLAVLHAEENRQPVPLAQVPTVLRQAVVDVEDVRFWDHDGVDLRGTLRALYANVHAGAIQQGGSTITQQLVKNTLLAGRRDAGLKVKEAALAIRLEQHLSKRQILERYLNTVYFGNGAYGVQAAAERYFGQDVGRLDVAQAALLAGIIQDPAGYDPLAHPGAARRRRSEATGRMVAAGDLTPAQARAVDAAPLPDRLVPPVQQDGGTGYFVEQVKQQLLDDPRLGASPGQRYDALFKGGLQVHTTLDPRLEESALRHVDQILPDTGGRFTAALVSVDPRTGAVRALVGGPGFQQAKFNLATQGRRQAGSSFKVFTLMAALEAGHSPLDTINGSSPCTIPNPGGTPDPWRPTNFEGEGHGTMTLTDATAHSVNCAYARLALIVGIDRVADVARRMGITTPLDPTPAMTLGGLRNGVSPLEMASAYATLAADGVHHDPYFVDRVDGPSGRTLFSTRPRGQRVVPAQDARVATSVLEQVVKRGTGVAARVPGHLVAGKTGTAEDYQDAWFVGYTPQVATSVWMGAPVGEVPMRDVGGIRVAGGTYPARIWSAFMADALAGLPDVGFPAPDPSLIPRGHYLRVPGERSSGSGSGSGRRRSAPTTTPAGSPPATTAPSPRKGRHR